ncbi:MAG: branched-chain amino acid ABC transporter substrate-binding protein [Rhodospirillaceae bacterium]|nr:branched-chain amino acid ABC transporter substrate-binding protein [Rhodospirillaceae bacterium]
MRKLQFATIAAAAAFGLAAPALAQDITIATIGPITGQYASFGEQMKRGAEMAVADLNAKGGVLGKKIKLVVEDDACDPKQAVAAANKVADMKVALVAGHFCSGSSIPASEVYARKKILQITPASTNPALTDNAAKKGWKIVNRVCGRDDAQGMVAGTYMAKNYKGKKIAILHDNTPYGKGLADETRKNLRKAGGKEAVYEAYKPGEKDYTALMGKMKAAGVAVLYIGGYDAEASLMIRQAHEMGYKPQMISGDALVTDNFWKVSGAAGEGVMMTFQPDPRELASAKAVVEKFRASKYDPEGYTLYSYAAVQLWAEAATRAKSIDAIKVSAALRSGKAYDTVIGKIALDKKGDVKNPEYVWFKWHDGKYAQVK